MPSLWLHRARGLRTTRGDERRKRQSVERGHWTSVKLRKRGCKDERSRDRGEERRDAGGFWIGGGSGGA